VFDTIRLFGYAAFSMPYLTPSYERSFSAVDVVGINEYFGWYYGRVADVSAFLTTVARKIYPKPFIVTETGADALREADAVRGNHTDAVPPPRGYSEEYQAWLIEQQWQQARKISGFAGMSIWVLRDFLCPEYREDNPIPFYNLKGLFDRDNQPKASVEQVTKMYRGESK
jgi:hypothetical protein